MNANLDAIDYSISVVVILVSLISCFLLGGRWEKKNLGKLGFKWGFFVIISTLLNNSLLLGILIDMAFEDGKPVIIFSILLLCAFFVNSIFYAFQRKRWALIAVTFLSLNPVWLVINFFYLKHRWQEFRDEAMQNSRGVDENGEIKLDKGDFKILTKSWRILLFGVVVWLTGFMLFVSIFKPYGRYLRSDDYNDIFLTALLPSCAAILLYWIYEKFVR